MLCRNVAGWFCAGRCSVSPQIVRFYFRAGFFVDTALVATGIILLGVTAWLAEWRDRVNSKAA